MAFIWDHVFVGIVDGFPVFWRAKILQRERCQCFFFAYDVIFIRSFFRLCDGDFELFCSLI